jgi:hypothetical protein
MRLEGLGQLKNPMNSSEIELATFRLVAQCLTQLRYRVPNASKLIRQRRTESVERMKKSEVYRLKVGEP